jgi:hypothetical protein
MGLRLWDDKGGASRIYSAERARGSLPPLPLRRQRFDLNLWR